ncbi:MAG: RluA family pseudouridine synthase [Bacteroidetes bacterium]|nr:RluA family pseudouridine synthase [Bacteroidota bacterium]
MDQPTVIWEDNHLLAINKPAGWLVQGDATGDATLADWCKAYIKEKYQKPGEAFLGVIHRLDRPVSGVVVFARTSKALTRMNKLFRSREVEKIYWALTDHVPPQKSGHLVHWLKKDEKKNKVTVFNKETVGALRSELQYQWVASALGTFLLELRPLTGRSHQIRVQLASMGCSIMGDLKYGSQFTTGDGSIALHARRLSFQHPVSKNRVDLSATVPTRLWWHPFQEK